MYRQIHTSDPGITAANRLLQGRDKTGALLMCRTAANLIIDNDSVQNEKSKARCRKPAKCFIEIHKTKEEWKMCRS